MIVPLLIHADPSKPFVLEMDASNFALSVIFSQPREDNFLHPIGFHSHKFFPVEINYEIHDRKLLAIVDVFEEWHHLLEGAQRKIIVYFNHKNI
jgi:hypothetical protein